MLLQRRLSCCSAALLGLAHTRASAPAPCLGPIQSPTAISSICSNTPPSWILDTLLMSPSCHRRRCRCRCRYRCRCHCHCCRCRCCCRYRCCRCRVAVVVVVAVVVDVVVVASLDLWICVLNLGSLIHCLDLCLVTLDLCFFGEVREYKPTISASVWYSLSLQLFYISIQTYNFCLGVVQFESLVADDLTS